MNPLDAASTTTLASVNEKCKSDEVLLYLAAVGWCQSMIDSGKVFVQRNHTGSESSSLSICLDRAATRYQYPYEVRKDIIQIFELHSCTRF